MDREQTFRRHAWWRKQGYDSLRNGVGIELIGNRLASSGGSDQADDAAREPAIALARHSGPCEGALNVVGAILARQPRPQPHPCRAPRQP